MLPKEESERTAFISDMRVLTKKFYEIKLKTKQRIVNAID